MGVAYACARSFPNTYGHQKEFIVTTMVIVLVTVFVFGCTTEYLLDHLQIETNVDEEQYMMKQQQQQQEQQQHYYWHHDDGDDDNNDEKEQQEQCHPQPQE